jgi:hypothetical protein
LTFKSAFEGMHSPERLHLVEEHPELRMSARGLEDQDGNPGRGGLADHVEGIRGRHDRIREGEEPDIGIVAAAVPEEAVVPSRQGGERLPQGRGRAARGRHHQAGAARGQRCQALQESGDILLREPVMTAVASHQHRDPGVGKVRQPGIGPGAGLLQTLRRDPMGRRQGVEDVRAPQAVVDRRPDEVGRPRSGAGILEKHRIGAPAGGTLHEPEIGHRAAAGGDEQVREGRHEGAVVGAGSLARVDRPPGHQPGEGSAGSHPADLGLEAERLGDAQGLQFVPGLAVGEHPGGQAVRSRQA